MSDKWQAKVIITHKAHQCATVGDHYCLQDDPTINRLATAIRLFKPMAKLGKNPPTMHLECYSMHRREDPSLPAPLAARMGIHGTRGRRR